jgi:type VI secretion system VasD/TssJ family lipoprotein
MKYLPSLKSLVDSVGVLLALILMTGCGGGPRALTVEVMGTSNLNTTSEGESGNAARVRIYQLSNATNFRTVTPETFWQDDVAALGAELLEPPKQVVLYPNTMERFVFEPVEGAMYIGVAADLRQPAQEQWRKIYDLASLGKSKQIVVQVGKDQVSIQLP